MSWSSITTKLLDPYDLKARLFPGLILLFPCLAYFMFVVGPKNPLLGALVSLICACGGPYLLANFVRTWGQRAQEALYESWGGAPTTLVLRHQDKTLAAPTKTRYHQLAKSRLGLSLPSRQDELADPQQADQAYIGCCDAIRASTRDKAKYPLVFKELVAYGFNRNAYGVRWLGASLSGAVIVLVLLNAGVLQFAQPWVELARLGSMTVWDRIALGIGAVWLLLWMFHFTPRTVRQAGNSYALRLFEALEKLPAKPAARKSASQATEPAAKP